MLFTPPPRHGPEPWLAASRQLTNTMLVEHCSGDYNRDFGGGAKMEADGSTVEWGEDRRPRGRYATRKRPGKKMMEHLGVVSWCYGWKEHSRFHSSALALFFLFLNKE